MENQIKTLHYCDILATSVLPSVFTSPISSYVLTLIPGITSISSNIVENHIRSHEYFGTGIFLYTCYVLVGWILIEVGIWYKLFIYNQLFNSCTGQKRGNLIVFDCHFGIKHRHFSLFIKKPVGASRNEHFLFKIPCQNINLIHCISIIYSHDITCTIYFQPIKS